MKKITFLWITDTQIYAKSFPHILSSQNDWVTRMHTEGKSAYVIHTGDMVDGYREDYQWQTADAEYRKWDESGVPYGILAGNHDLHHEEYIYDKYKYYFGKSRYEKNPWFGGSYDNNKGHFDLVRAEGIDFLFLYMSYSRLPREDIDWMNTVLSAYSEHIAVLCVHDYLNTDRTRSRYGDILFHNVVLQNPNVRLVLCGHYHGAARRRDIIDDDGDGRADREVFQLLSDYQLHGSGGDGFLRVLELYPGKSLISVKTYSPYTGETSCFPNKEEEADEYGYKDEFTLPFSFEPPKKAVRKGYKSDVLPAEKVTVYTQSGIITIPVYYFNVPSVDGSLNGAGLYDRNFSLSCTGIAENESECAFIAVSKGAISEISFAPIHIPENGFVLVVPPFHTLGNGEKKPLSDMIKHIRTGDAVYTEALPDIAPVKDYGNVFLTTQNGIKKSVLAVNKYALMSDNWIIFDRKWGEKTIIPGVDNPHFWNFLFSFVPTAEPNVFRVGEADTTTAKTKIFDIPEGGFVLAINTYSGKPTLFPSICKELDVGKEVQLEGYQILSSL